jgi:flavin reductase (DIM6/NTAB) family NADH-FMN oxidoreductase RutF
MMLSNDLHREASSSTTIRFPPSTSPNPTWKPGDKESHPYGADCKHVSIDPKELPSSYHLLISGVVPRPIAFVSSQSAAGCNNVAPYSYFGAVAHDPPTICIGICRNRNGSDKDTYRNIAESGEFVVNIISDWFVEAANHCSGAFAPDIDEIEISGLTPINSTLVKPPRIAESAFQMECKLQSITDVRNDQGAVTSHVVFGRVVMFHVLEHVLEKNSRGYEANIDKFRPMGRLGGDTYCKVGDSFDILRPKV